MQAQAIDSRHSWPPNLVARNGVVVLSGYGLDIRIWRGFLRIEDGIGKARRIGILHRATSGLERLVVLGHTGAVSLDAIRWLADVGVGYVQIDEDSRVLAAFGPRGTNRPALIRAQALAPQMNIGLEIVRYLLREKLHRQRECISDERRNVADAESALRAISEATEMLDHAGSIARLRLAEAQAAAAYWAAFSGMPVHFAKRDEARIPLHWRAFLGRSSPLTGGPRLAVNPANALLNYLYAIVESEATIAARIVGLEPGLGILHTDQPNRDSLADDLMEPVRPIVDMFVLRLLADRRFALADFHETRQGVCRITSRLARELAEVAQAWRPLVGAVAEDVAKMLGSQSRSERPVATPLSGRNRSAGRGATATRSVPSTAKSGPTCVWCGGPTRPNRSTCSKACTEAAHEAAMPAFLGAGIAALETSRSTRVSEAGRERIGSAARQHITAGRRWAREHGWPPDWDAYRREILPRLADTKVRELAVATGLSVAYCRRIKRGEVVPHPMWWEQLSMVSQQQRAGHSGKSEEPRRP